jgi:hypothetical protein
VKLVPRYRFDEPELCLGKAEVGFYPLLGVAVEVEAKQSLPVTPCHRGENPGHDILVLTPQRHCRAVWAFIGQHLLRSGFWASFIEIDSIAHAISSISALSCPPRLFKKCTLWWQPRQDTGAKYLAIRIQSQCRFRDRLGQWPVGLVHVL